MPVKVLFVCLGNICRSPTAEGVFRYLVREAGLHKHIHIDSAGTANWHSGRTPDPRTIAAAKKRNVDLSVLRARAVTAEDFEEFDYILAMDDANLKNLQNNKPVNYKGHLSLFLDFATHKLYRHVPDPYHGEADGFELVLDLVEDAAAGLLLAIKARHF
jgi:protein-tyrosine phosphatase